MIYIKAGVHLHWFQHFWNMHYYGMSVNLGCLINSKLLISYEISPPPVVVVLEIWAFVYILVTSISTMGHWLYTRRRRSFGSYITELVRRSI